MTKQGREARDRRWAATMNIIEGVLAFEKARKSGVCDDPKFIAALAAKAEMVWRTEYARI